jgi:hypothetical protein
MITRITYFAASVAAFLGASTLHVTSYFQFVPRQYLSAAWFVAAALCVPLVVLFFRLRKIESQEQVWHRFWNAVIERCPRWIWGSMSVAWILAMITFVRSVFGQEPAPITFHSAVVLMPIGAALSYSVTLCRQ